MCFACAFHFMYFSYFGSFLFTLIKQRERKRKRGGRKERGEERHRGRKERGEEGDGEERGGGVRERERRKIFNDEVAALSFPLARPCLYVDC